MLSRRDMIGNLAGAVTVLGGGCRVFSGRSDSLAVSPPYEDVIRDRLWMWGHGGTAFDKPRHTAGIPPAEPIEINDACRYLGIPNVSNVLSVDEIKDGRIYVTAGLDDRNVKLSVALPCLISVDSDINTPRLPSYKVKKTITDDSVKIFTFADFDDQNEKHYGLAGSATQVERIFPPEKNAEKCYIDGNCDEQAAAIFELLRSKKMI